MKALSEYCGIQKGTTITQDSVIELTIEKDGAMWLRGPTASMFIYPKWDLDYNDDRPEVACKGYVWTMGKAEYHYRNKKNDKHARRWVKRHKKAVRL